MSKNLTIDYIFTKAERGERLCFDELMTLYQEGELSSLAHLADSRRREVCGTDVLYNKNFHLEPSNICIHRCEFCSFRRESSEQDGAWSMSIEEIIHHCKKEYYPGITEIHIVGSVHPDKGLDYYAQIVKTVRDTLPKEVTIKAYSAVEIVDMAKREGCSIETILKTLKDVGLEALPGGGAEILNDCIRGKICPDKCSSSEWLQVHKIAHHLGIRTNATMLFGHIESNEDRINHLLTIRELQDQTGGFDAFIPLKYHSANNPAAAKYQIQEISSTEIMRTFAISRIALDNIPHIKAYWPMLGKDLTQVALSFGADDIDGTVNNTTKIYSMAGAQEQKPILTVEELENLVYSAGYTPKERNSFYK